MGSNPILRYEVKRALATVLELLQWVIMLAMIMPLQYLARWLAQAAGWLARVPYYRGCVVPKRRLLGSELWQEHDVQIGIWPPEGHPRRVKVMSLDELIRESSETAQNQP